MRERPRICPGQLRRPSHPLPEPAAAVEPLESRQPLAEKLAWRSHLVRSWKVVEAIPLQHRVPPDKTASSFLPTASAFCQRQEESSEVAAIGVARA